MQNRPRVWLELAYELRVDYAFAGIVLVRKKHCILIIFLIYAIQIAGF